MIFVLGLLLIVQFVEDDRQGMMLKLPLHIFPNTEGMIEGRSVNYSIKDNQRIVHQNESRKISFKKKVKIVIGT